jgi:protein SCO1
MTYRLLLIFLSLLGAAITAKAADLTKRVGFDQRLAAQVPLDAHFKDETGATVSLGQYIHGRPTLLIMTYFDCPNLCTVVLNGLTASLRHVRFDPGKQFEVVAISISPRDTPHAAAQKKAEYLKQYGRAGTAAGWHFLTGDPSQIQQVAHTIGFRYFYDKTSHQYAHAAGIVLLTGAGKISQYMPGVSFPAQELRLALVRTSENQIGTLTDRLWLLCYHYDPASGRYNLIVDRILQAAGLSTVLALGGLVAGLLHRDRTRRSRSVPP